MQYQIARPRQRPAAFEHRPQWHSGPLGDVRPALDAVVFGDLRVPLHADQIGEGQCQRLLDQSADLERPSGEPVAGEYRVGLIFRRPAVGARRHGPLLRAVVLTRGQVVQENALNRIDHALQGVLHRARRLARRAGGPDVYQDHEPDPDSHDRDGERLPGGRGAPLHPEDDRRQLVPQPVGDDESNVVDDEGVVLRFAPPAAN